MIWWQLATLVVSVRFLSHNRLDLEVLFLKVDWMSFEKPSTSTISLQVNLKILGAISAETKIFWHVGMGMLGSSYQLNNVTNHVWVLRHDVSVSRSEGISLVTLMGLSPKLNQVALVIDRSEWYTTWGWVKIFESWFCKRVVLIIIWCISCDLVFLLLSCLYNSV